MPTGPLDWIPLRTVFPLILVLGLLAVETGFLIGRWRRSKSTIEREAPAAAMVAAMLGLLAFMLAFTFSSAAANFDMRRRAVLEEAQILRSAMSRCSLLPENITHAVRPLLVEYTLLRAGPMTPENIMPMIQKSEELQSRLWKQAQIFARTSNDSVMAVMLAESLDSLSDIHSRRVFFGIKSRIPITIWLTLLFLMVSGMSSVGYLTGLSQTCRSPQMVLFSLAFSAVLFLIFELDRGHEGRLQVSQQPLQELADKLLIERPESK
jgi:hypothetical protein